MPQGKYTLADIRTGATAGTPPPPGYSQGTSNPPNGGQISDVDNPEPNDAAPMGRYTLADIAPAGLTGPLPGQPSAPVPAAWQGPRSVLRNFASAGADVAFPLADVGIGALKGLGSDVSNGDAIISRIPHLGRLLTPGVTDQSRATLRKFIIPTDTAQSVGKGVEQVGEFLLPGLGEEAAGAKLAELAPRLGRAAEPLARLGVSTLGSGAVNKLQGGGFGTGALMGGAGSGIGEGMRAIAPVVAESGLGVTGANRMYGRTVGRAILDDTHGIKPSVIEQSARAKIAELKPQVEQIANDAAQAGSRGSLSPALASVDQKIGNHMANRAVNSAAELTPLKTFLERDAVTGLPLASAQPPPGLLRLKRGLDSDFIGNWNPTRNTNNELDAAKSAYGNLADEFHASAPGTRELDQRISSLIPVAERANRTSLGAGITQNILNRFRTPTGALVGGLGGMEAGYHERGIPGAVAGAVAGATVPALIASPEAQMFIARAANNFFPRLAIPAAVGGALQLKRLNTEPKR